MAKQGTKETLRTEVKKYIMREIAVGNFKPGERIVETKLAKEMNISQAPVREAILELSILGILEERPYAGSFVRHPASGDVEDLYNVRALVEQYSANAAAINRTDADMEKLALILQKMKECKDPDQFVDLDHSFHEAIADATGNKILKRIWEALSTYELTYQTILANKWTFAGLYDAHKTLYDVIGSGNGPAAGAEMFLHIDRFRSGVIDTIAEKEIASKSD